MDIELPSGLRAAVVISLMHCSTFDRSAQASESSLNPECINNVS